MAVNKSSREEYAIKFFVDRAAFDQEVGLYARDSDDTSQHVSQFLPQVLCSSVLPIASCYASAESCFHHSLLAL